MTWCLQEAGALSRAGVHASRPSWVFNYRTAVCETEQHRRKKKPSEGIGSCQDIQEAVRADGECSEQQSGHRATCPRGSSPVGSPAKPWGLRQSPLRMKPFVSTGFPDVLQVSVGTSSQNCPQSCKKAFPNNYHPLESCAHTAYVQAYTCHY